MGRASARERRSLRSPRARRGRPALRRLLFPRLEREVSVLVLGTATYRRSPPDVSTELLDAWLAAGGNALDTAREYGTAESVLGRWMESRRCRAEVVVVTKCAHPDEGAPQRVTRRDIAADLEESLEALRTDYVDLLLLHRDDPTVPVGEILEILNEHRESGRIRAFGASNWTTVRLDEAREYAELRGLEGFACSSAQLSLAVQAEPMWPGTLSAGDPVSRRWHERCDLPLLAWSAQAGGYFVRRDADADPDLVRVYGTPENRERRRRAEEIGRGRGVDANAVALAWVLHQPFPVWPIVGSQTPAELRATLPALEVKLSAEELRWLALEDEAA